MPPGQITATAGDLVRKFTHYSDVALNQPVVVTRHGKPCNVLISVEEYNDSSSGTSRLSWRRTRRRNFLPT